MRASAGRRRHPKSVCMFVRTSPLRRGALVAEKRPRDPHPRREVLHHLPAAYGTRAILNWCARSRARLVTRARASAS